jgi:hypothetical protein
MNSREFQLGDNNFRHPVNNAGFGPSGDLAINLDWAPLIGIEPGFKAEFLFSFEADHANSVIIYDQEDFSLVFECNNFTILSTSWLYENNQDIRKRFIVTGWNQLSRANPNSKWRQSPYKALATIPGNLFTFGFEDMWNDPNATVNSIDWNDAILSIRKAP